MQKEIQEFSKSNLKPIQTKITYLNGKKYSKEIYNNEKPEEFIEESLIGGYVVQIEPDLTINEIIPHLYLSGDDVAQSYDLLKTKSITHILNLTMNIQNLFETKGIIYKRICIYDLPTENILEHFNEAFEFIDNALLYSSSSINRQNNNLLVHCNAGVSRSASFVIGYLLKNRLFPTYNDTYKHVKECRNKICPNDGFLAQLKQYEKKLHMSS